MGCWDGALGQEGGREDRKAEEGDGAEKEEEEEVERSGRWREADEEVDARAEGIQDGSSEDNEGGRDGLVEEEGAECSGWGGWPEQNSTGGR